MIIRARDLEVCCDIVSPSNSRRYIHKHEPSTDTSNRYARADEASTLRKEDRRLRHAEIGGNGLPEESAPIGYSVSNGQV